MTDPLRIVALHAQPSRASTFVSTFLGLVLFIVALFYVDTHIVRLEQRESLVRAARLYADGETLLVKGDASRASDRFASAAAIDRRNTRYALALIHAMVADGRRDDAERELDALLARAGNDGAVNLAKARMLAASDQADVAPVYYHRSIYGEWSADSIRARNDVRFELAELLATRHDSGAVLAELLPLEATLPDSAPMRRRLAHLFLAAGSPRRSVPILRALLRSNPKDADAYTGLGEAALAVGNFAVAHADLSEAQRLQPDDIRSATQLAIADSILVLDPRAKGLTFRQHAARASLLLTMVIGERERCAGQVPTGEVTNAARRLGKASAWMSPQTLTALAVQLWASRTTCVPSYVVNRALVLLLASME
ncbi:MAG: tetratricopeptide repeat protein [Gemmatimonadota bacterium]